jgi:hypothetical protein
MHKLIDRHGIVQHAFTDAVRMFSTELSKDELKSRWIEDAQINNIESLLHVLGDAQKHYTERKGESKVRDALDGLAEKAHHYSSIMDVFVAHHPEYTALVWGAMKFLFVVGFLNALGDSYRDPRTDDFQGCHESTKAHLQARRGTH